MHLEQGSCFANKLCKKGVVEVCLFGLSFRTGNRRRPLFVPCVCGRLTEKSMTQGLMLKKLA